jgi:hypothetical protein
MNTSAKTGIEQRPTMRQATISKIPIHRERVIKGEYTFFPLSYPRYIL